MQRRIHQRYRYTQIADLEFRRIKSGISVFVANVTRDCDPHVLARHFGQKLPMHQIAIKRDTLVLDGRRTAAGIRIGCQLPSRSQRLRQYCAHFIRSNVHFGLRSIRCAYGSSRQSHARVLYGAAGLRNGCLEVCHLLVECLRMLGNESRSLRLRHRRGFLKNQNHCE